LQDERYRRVPCTGRVAGRLLLPDVPRAGYFPPPTVSSVAFICAMNSLADT
jgi:hypothetical protein